MQEDQILAQLGRQGWKITSRYVETRREAQIDPSNGQRGAQQDVPTGNMIWVITSPDGRNSDTMTVRPEQGTAVGQDGPASGFTVVKPPADLPAGSAEKPANGQTRTGIQGNREVVEQYQNGVWTTIGYKDIPAPAGPASRPPEPNVSTSAPKIPVWNQQTNSYEWQDNPNYRAPAAPAKRTQVVGNKLVDLDTGQTIATLDAGWEFRNGQDGEVIAINPQTLETKVVVPKSGKQTVLNVGNTPNIAVQDASGTISSQKNPAYTSAAQQILQNQYDTIAYIKGQMEQGTMSPLEASTYMDALRQQTQAALAGTTPYQQAKDAEQQKLDKAQLGRDVLTTRVSQSNNLAQKLIDTIKPTGVTGFDFSKVDPFGASSNYVDERMGGKQVGDMASQLLMGLQQGAGPQGGGLPPNINWAALGFGGQGAPSPQPVLAGGGPAPMPAGPQYTPDQLAAANTEGIPVEQYVAWHAQNGGA